MNNPAPLDFGKYYHIYNRGNNRENVFIQERNYAYFMELWWKYTYPIVETFAYCLLRNHFHAVIYIKEQEDLSGFWESTPDQHPRSRGRHNKAAPDEKLSGLESPKSKSPSQYFSNFFNAYTRGVNLATQRSGALFESPFERKQVSTEEYLMRLIIYTHQNPQKHGFVDDFRSWPYSSYLALIDNSPTKLKRDKILELFGGREGFIRLNNLIARPDRSVLLTSLQTHSPRLCLPHPGSKTPMP